MRAALIFPHQLFRDHPALKGADLAVLIEDPLIFRELRFHAAKLVLHRASMQSYAEDLRSTGVRVEYLRSSELLTVEDLATRLRQLTVRTVQYVDPSDDWLDRRLTRTLNRHQIVWTRLDDPHFLTSDDMFQAFSSGKKKFFSQSSMSLRGSDIRFCWKQMRNLGADNGASIPATGKSCRRRYDYPRCTSRRVIDSRKSPRKKLQPSFQIRLARFVVQFTR